MAPDDTISFPEKRLTADSLSCRRGGRAVFEDLGFDLGAGDCLLLKGNNGSGKSSLLRILAGLLSATAGSVTWGNISLAGPAAAEMGLMIYSGHQHALKPVLSLGENCANYYQLMTGVPLADEKLELAARAFGLYDLIEQPVKYFSSGQTHRGALLRFLLLDRPIWLMDEPTVGLDGENRKRLVAIMNSHMKCGGIIIAASHDPLGVPSAVLNMADFAAKNADLEQWL